VSEEAATKALKNAGLTVDEAWQPYLSKLVFLLDAIDNMPRLRVSDGLMNAFLWLLREAGVKNVPSASYLRKVQTSLRDKNGVRTVHCTSPKENTYSFNNPADIIANVSVMLFVANPTY
jgi:hypothetical protein